MIGEMRELHFKELTATQDQTTRVFTEGTGVLSANGTQISMKSCSVPPELHEKVRSWVANYAHRYYVRGSGERGPGKQ